MRIITTGFPGPGKGCLFVEVEDDDGRIIDAGEWRKREDGLAELVLEAPTPSELSTLRRLRAGELKLVGQEVTPDMINAGTAFVLNNPGIKVADKFRGIFLAMLDAAPPAAKEEGNG
tara:strand:- start:987 stop:1337 length:351 start_codon:yes stop_codon:yes gene_type:complete